MEQQKAILLLGVILLAAFLSHLQAPITGQAITGDYITIDSSSCTLQGTNFEICATVDWQGQEGDYAKVYITNGESLQQSPKQYNNPFTYCQQVQDREGNYAINTYIYEHIGKLKLLDTTTTIECKRELAGYTLKRSHFRAKHTIEQGKGEGVHVIQLAGKPTQCIVQGQWETDNREINRITRSCHKFKGFFTAVLTESSQSGTNDPTAARWIGPSKPIIDPPLESYDGYFVKMKTCDNLYLDKQRYGVTAKVTDFEQQLVITWEYNDEAWKPEGVDFVFDINCMFKQKQPLLPQRTTIQRSITIEEPAVEEPTPFTQPIETVEQTQPLTFKEKFKQVLRIIFL